MGLDDLVNKAKDMLGNSAGGTTAAGGSATGGGGAAGLIDKAKEVLTDERIDQVAGAIKDKTPDNIDAMVDKVAEKGKQFNN